MLYFLVKSRFISLHHFFLISSCEVFCRLLTTIRCPSGTITTFFCTPPLPEKIPCESPALIAGAPSKRDRTLEEREGTTDTADEVTIGISSSSITI
ncbi:unnamed protein product [Acanthoscelides obtectus]|uniref:Uncharacterized protein n=1 Tax=Acanthoscelides obtectus TaxID=200917 RepID=A0A9P0K1M5_ACAOB|nr:unnamed protein product [Acanthoscelides obtectus]CAK1648646.1 hypothetical protein AOBTE_LOCUS15800 [Acanthoscelides obtectus]